MYTVDIDTGGTMTDALISDGEQARSIKVDTTPHDYTVSFRECLSEGAKQLGYPSVSAFLEQVKLIRWSSTITTNVLGERRGSKVGLLVSQGSEQTLYGANRSAALDQIIAAQNVIGLSATPTTQETLGAVKRLLEDGVRRVCVSLGKAFPDNTAEKSVKRIIEDQYPDHYLGAVPVLLGSEMAQIGDDATRTHYSLINAYVHSQLATSLFKADDMLKHEEKWDGPLLIGNTTGGVARIGKTKAVDTIESGPVFGTFGGAQLAREYALKQAVCFDVGGTTTKASMVKDGRPVYQRGGEFINIPVRTPLALLRSAVVGGGSIARAAGKTVKLGPESMGAAPGPVCYGLGGDEVTLSDALLVLGYLDPNNFLGGRRALSVEKATQAIEAKLAKPLGVSVEQAAGLVRDEAVAMMANLVQHVLTEAGSKAADSALIAFGGNGPLFGALVAAKLGINQVLVPSLGPIFSAFGSAISDVVHTYQRAVSGNSDTAAIVAAFAALREQAERDLRAEGFPIEATTFEHEVEPASGATLHLGAAIAAAAIPAGAIELIRLTARHAVGTQSLPRVSPAGMPAAKAHRPVSLGATTSATPIYAWQDLGAGAHINGAAIAANETLTCLIPPGWQLDMDARGTAKLTRAAS